MKRITRKKQVYLSVGIGILALLIVIGTITYKMLHQITQTQTSESSYEVTTLKKSDPLLFKGISQPKNTLYFNLNQSLGDISTIAVKNGQEVNENDLIATYKNLTLEDQATEQEQTLNKLDLTVTNAQTSLNSAVQKQKELEGRVATIQNELNVSASKTVDEETKQAETAEIQTRLDAAKDTLEGQKDVVMQAQQSLDAANLDLSSTNATIEQTKSKITSTISAPFKGIIYVNEKGRTDATIPYATLVSPETVIQGTVTEYDYAQLQENQEVTLQILNNNQKIDGVISFVSALPENAVSQTQGSTASNSISTFSFIVEPKETIHYGFNVQISVPINYLEIGKESVIKEKDKLFVFIYKNGEVKKQKITATEEEDVYLVQEGLKENEQIISNPDENLKDGQEVVVS